MLRIIRSGGCKLAVSTALPLALAACGGVDPTTESAGESAEDESIGTLAEAFGESTCGTASPDSTDPLAGDVAASDGTYNHAQCTKSYVVKFSSLDSSRRAYAAYWGPTVPPTGPISGCNGMWVNLSVWKLIAGTYKLIGTSPTQNGVLAPNGFECLIPSTELQIPSTGTYKLIGQAGFALSYQSVRVGWWNAETRNMATANDRGYTGDGDWASGLIKGECALGRSMLGVSRIPTGTHGVRNLLCYGSSAAGGTVTLNFTNGNDRRFTGSGDWDPGFIKGECPDGHVMTGLAQNSSGVINKAQCAAYGVAAHTSSCTKMDFSTGNARGLLQGGDFSPGDFKGQCADLVTGISKDASGKPKAILCCDVH